MTLRAWALAGTASLMALSSTLAAHAQVADPQAMPAAPEVTPASVFMPPVNPVPPLDDRARAALRRAVNGDQRIESQRDRWRNPDATLQFFGVRPSDTVVEIWPGAGWYTSVIGPYLKQGDGKLIVGHFDAASSDSRFVRQVVEAYRARFAGNPAVYGSVTVVPFGPQSALLAPPNSVDKVLTFRNVHNWMAQGWVEKAFADFYTVLKPGGILGIEEHRGRTDEPQDPLARDGYVREDYVIQMAREAGFEYIGSAEINANPADTKDHPFGVWTLPPVSRTSPIGEPDDPGFDRARYDAIGESDRMTLRFRKPLDATGVGPPSRRMAAADVPVTIIPGPPPPPPAPRRGRRGSSPPPPPVTPAATSGTQVASAEPTARPGTATPPAAATSATPANATAPTSEAAKPATAAPATALKPAAETSPAGRTPPSSGRRQPPATSKDGRATPPPDAAAKSDTAAPASASTRDRARDTTASGASTRGQNPAAGGAPKAGSNERANATAEPAPTGKSGSARPPQAEPAKDRSAPAETPATTGRAARTKAGKTTKAEDTEARPNSTRASRRAAAEPATPEPKTKSKSKTKAKADEAPSRTRNNTRQANQERSQAARRKQAEPKDKAKKASPARKGSAPAKPDPNKPDWILPPKKKKN